MLRKAVVSGQFYPGDRDSLLRSIQSFLPPEVDMKPAIAVMSPHAGYPYSGAVAGKTFAGTSIPEDVIILGPNHTGRGHQAAVYASGAWSSPLGLCEINDALAQDILEQCPMTASDTLAHQFEHSLEVQMPFLQHLQSRVKIVPICISRLSLPDLLDLGNGIARVIANRSDKPLIVASTDMTHFEPGQVARDKDFKAIDKVLALDPAGLYDVVLSNRISMCGVMPTVVMLQAAMTLGATSAELVAYSNSGDVTGDQSEVVGYAGVRVF